MSKVINQATAAKVGGKVVEQTASANANDKEYSVDRVPNEERRGFLSLVFTWIGYVFTVTIMSAGGNIANGAQSFQEAMTAVYAGYAILFGIAMATSLVSMRTGLSFGLLGRFTFGTIGAKIIALFTAVTLCGWFSINCYLMGEITNVLFPMIPAWPITIIFGFLMVFSALKGQKVMNYVGLFATIAVFAVGITAIIIGLKDANNVAEGGILAIQNTSGVTLTMKALITISVGSVVCGCCSWAPDIMRFSKGKKTTTAVMGVGLGICGPFMLVIGIIGTLVYQQYDIAYILQAQGFLPLAFIGLVANVWSTAQGNAYSSSLNLASIFPMVKREKLLVIFGVAGTFIGLFGLYRYFSTWLTFLATAFPPMAGVVLADYVFTWRFNTPTLTKAMPYLPKVRVLSLIAYVAGVTSRWWLEAILPDFGLQTINALAVAFILEVVFGAIKYRKESDRIKEVCGFDKSDSWTA